MSENIQSKLQDLIQKNKCLIFMKGTPEAPMCGFSAQSIQVLKEAGLPVVGINVLEDPEIRQGIKDLTQWPTIPQIFIDGEFIGGCDIITEMYETGELQKLIQQKSIGSRN